MAGKTAEEAAIADSLVDGISDCFDGIVPIVFGPEDQKVQSTCINLNINMSYSWLDILIGVNDYTH